MKKIIPIFLALFIFLTSTCFAAYKPDPNRWLELGPISDFNEYLDTATLNYSEKLDSVDFWLCRAYTNEDKHTLINYKINKTDNTITICHVTVYESSTNKVLETIEVPPTLQTPEKITPETNGEFYYKLLFFEIPRIVAELQQQQQQQQAQQ